MESSFLGNTRPFFQGVPAERAAYEASHQNERSIIAPPNPTPPATPTLPHVHPQQYQSYPTVATSAHAHIHSRSMTPATPYSNTFSDPGLLDPHRHSTRPPDTSPDPHKTARSSIHYPVSERLIPYSSPSVGPHQYKSQPSTTFSSRGITTQSVIDSKTLYNTPSSTTIDSHPHSNLYVDPRIHMDPRYPPKHPDSRMSNPRPPETSKALGTRPPDSWASYHKHQFTTDPKLAYNSQRLYGSEGKSSYAAITSSVQTPININGSKEALYLSRRQEMPQHVHNIYKKTHDNLVNGSRDAIYPNGSQTYDNRYTSDPRYTTEQYTSSIKQQPLDFRSPEAQNSNSERMLESRHSVEVRPTTQRPHENENRPLEDSVLDLSVKTVKQVPDSTAPDNEKATPPVTSDKSLTHSDTFRRPLISDSNNPPIRSRDASPSTLDPYRSTYPSHHLDPSKVHSHSGTSITVVPRSTPPVAPHTGHPSHPLGSPQIQQPRGTPPHNVVHTTQSRTTPPIHARSATPNQVRTTPPSHAQSPHGINGSVSPLPPSSPSPRSAAMLPPSKRPGDPIYLEHYAKYARLNNTSPIRPSVMSPPASLPSPQDKHTHMQMLKREMSIDPSRGLHLLAAASIKTEQDHYAAEKMSISAESGDKFFDRSREQYLERRDSHYSRPHSLERKETSSIHIDSPFERKDIKKEITEKWETLQGLDSRGVSVEKKNNISVTSSDPKYLYRQSMYGPHTGWMTAPDPTTINSLPQERQKYQASQHLIQQHPTGYHSSPSTAPVTVPSSISGSPATYPYVVERHHQSPRSAPPPHSSPRASSHHHPSSYPQTTDSRLPTHTLSYSHSGATQVHSGQVSQHHTTVAKTHHQANVYTGSRQSPIASTVSPSSVPGPSQPRVYPHPYTHPEAQHYQHLQAKHDAHLHQKHPLHQEKHYQQHPSAIHHQKQVLDRGLHYGKYTKMPIPQASPQTSSSAPGQPISHHGYPYMHHQYSDTHPSYSNIKRHPSSTSPHPISSAHSGTGQAHPGISSTHHPVVSTHSGPSSGHPVIASSHPGSEVTHQITGSAHQSNRPAHPGSALSHPVTSSAQPGVRKAHPTTGSVSPATGSSDPGARTAHPNTSTAHSGAGSMHTSSGSGSIHPGTMSSQTMSGPAQTNVSSAHSSGDLSKPSTVSTSHGVSSSHPGAGSAHLSVSSANHANGSSLHSTSIAQSSGSSINPVTVSTHTDAGLRHSNSELAHTGVSTSHRSTGPGPSSSSIAQSGVGTAPPAASPNNNMIPPGHSYSQQRRSPYVAAPQRSPAPSSIHPSQSRPPSVSQSSYASNYPYTSSSVGSSSQSGPPTMTHSANQPPAPAQMPAHSPHSNHPRQTAEPHPSQIQTTPPRSYSGLPHSHPAHHAMPPGHPSGHPGSQSYPKPPSHSASEGRSVSSQPPQLTPYPPHIHPQHPSNSYGHPRHTTPHVPGSTHPQSHPQSHPHALQAPSHTRPHVHPHAPSYGPPHTSPHSRPHGTPSSAHMSHPSANVQSLQHPSHPGHLHYPSHKSSNPNQPYSSTHPLHSTRIPHTSQSNPYAKIPMSSPLSHPSGSYSQPGIPYQYPRMPPIKSEHPVQYHGYPNYPHPHSHPHQHMNSYSDRTTGPASIDTDPSRIKTKGEQKAFDPRNARQWTGGPWHPGPHSSGAPYGPYPPTTNVPNSTITASQPDIALNIKQEVLSQEESGKLNETSQSSNKSLEPGKAALAHKLQKKLSRTDSGENHLIPKSTVEKQEIKEDKKEPIEKKWDFSFDKLMDDLAANHQGCVSRKSKTLAKRYEQKIHIQLAIENDLMLPPVEPIIEESDSEPEAPVKFRGKFKSIKDKAVERVILTYASHSDDSATEMIPDDDASDFEAEMERELRAERKSHSAGNRNDKGRKSNTKHQLKAGKNKENKPNNKQDSDFSASIGSESGSSSSDGSNGSLESDLEEDRKSKKKVRGRRPKWQTDSSESDDYIPRRKGKKSKKVRSDEDSYKPSKKNKSLKEDTTDSEEEIKSRRRKRKERLDSDYEEEIVSISKGKKNNRKGRRRDDTNESDSDFESSITSLSRKKHKSSVKKRGKLRSNTSDSSVSEDDRKTLAIGKRRLKANHIESSMDSDEEIQSKTSKSEKVRLRNEKHNTHSGNEMKHKKKSKLNKSQHSDSSTENENEIKSKKKNKYNKIGSDADSDVVISSKGNQLKKRIDSESDMDAKTKMEEENIVEDDFLEEENAHKEPDSVLEKLDNIRQKELGREDVKEMKSWMEEMFQEMEKQLKPFEDASEFKNYYKRPQFGNGNDFPQGWETEVKDYKENIARIPKKLCIAVPISTTSNKNNSKKSRDRDVGKDSPSNKKSSPAKNTRSNSKGIIKTSMAVADGENLSVAARPEISSVMQRFFDKVLSDNTSDSKIYSRKFPPSPFPSYPTRSPTGLTPSPSVAPSMLASDDSDLDSLTSLKMNRPASDSVPVSRKRSIANSLMKKLQTKNNNKKFNTQWLNRPRSILEATNKPQLLPTPGMPSTEEDYENMEPSQLKLATFFRKETVINYRDNFDVVITKNGINEFSPTLYKARTRTKTKENEDTATVNAIFGADIPEHILKRNNKEKHKTKKKDPKKLFDKKHEKVKSTSSLFGVTSRSSTPGDSNILDDDDDSEITTEASPSVLRMITLVPPSSTKKVRRNRKFRSGFDYIRKTKKKKPDEEPTPNKRKLAVRKPMLWPEQSRDIAGEVRTWVVNKGLGETVLHKAARLQYHDVVLYCVENPKEFDVNVKDNAGYTPLHEACNRGHLDIAQILCAHGGAVNAPGHGGMRPLHEAVENGYGELARLLLSYGADPALTTYAGQTVAALAEESHCKALIEGYIADLKGTKGQMWHFTGPTGFLDLPEQGFNLFNKVPRSLFDFRRRHLMRMAQRKRRQIRNVQSNPIEIIKIKEEKVDDKDDSVSTNKEGNVSTNKEDSVSTNKEDTVSTNKTLDSELTEKKEETALVHIKQEVIEQENTEETIIKELPLKSNHSDVDKSDNEVISKEPPKSLDVKDEKPNILSHKKENDSEDEEKEEDFISYTFECSNAPLPEIYYIYGKQHKYFLLKELLLHLNLKSSSELIIAAGAIETIELSSEQFMRLAHGCVLGSVSRSLVDSSVAVELVKITTSVEKLIDVELVKL